MKNNFYLFLIVFAIAASSCKKQDSSVKDEIKRDVELEGDHLAFKDYSTFVDYFKVVSSMNKSQREQWEKSLNFTSMQTAYEHFNEELNELEKGSKENYFKGFSSLKLKYNESLLFTENSYRINNSGISEAILTNKNGFVKVGKDYLHFKESGVTTYKGTSFEKAEQLSKSNLVSTENLSLTAPTRNSFTPVMGQWNIINKERGRVLFRNKAYNLHTDALGYESFAALEGQAEHLNIFGTWRGVRMALSLSRSTTPGRYGLSPLLRIEYNNLANTFDGFTDSANPPRGTRGDDPVPSVLKTNLVELNPNFFQGLDNVERFDRVMCVTKGIAGNPSAALSIAGASGSQLLNFAVDSGHSESVDVYWRGVSMENVNISAYILPGSGLASHPQVIFDLFSLYGRSYVQYQ
ncbi:hypothetical protein [Pedobacter sp. FW305-3-2-15-E-R2A2]|uniref:hypothetical protein n=1 Tax=Pedobacter sp. FW305-3-2-15-E-R2A2 TaxID=3140251 RepID=UPI00313FF759